MTRRWSTVPFALTTLIAILTTADVRAADKLVTANANLSTLVTADDTTLRWTGNYTVTVDASVAFTVSGIDAGSFTAVIDFQNADRKILLGNTAGNVVFEASGGSISVQGAGTGARTAGFLVSPSLSDEIVEIQTAIDDAANANYFIIGEHTLRLSGSAPEIGILDIGADGTNATIDVNESATIDFINPTGDFMIDVASSKTLSLTSAWNVGANTVTVAGGNSSSAVTHGAQVTLDNANSVLNVSGTVSVDDLDLGASAAITLEDGALLTLTDAVAIGARTLTISGVTGSSAETVTATGGFTLDNADSVLKISGDSADPLIISKVDTGADLNAGKGIDADQSVDITALTVSHNATLDVAASKTLGGNVTFNAAKTLVLNNSGTVSSITAGTAAGTVQITGTGTISTFTNNIANTTLDVDENSTVSNLAVDTNTTVNVASGKTLSGSAVVAANRVLTANAAGTIAGVKLNGNNAELNITAGGTISSLDVDADGGVLDVDTNDCTVTRCTLTAGSGNLTVENASRTITSASGFDVNDNTLTLTQASGTITLVNLDTNNGVIDVDAATTITTTDVSASATVQVATGIVLTTSADIAGGGELTTTETGTISTVQLNGSGAEFHPNAAGTVSTLNVLSSGGVIDVDESTTISNVNLSADAGGLTLDVADGKTLTGSIDVNDNTLTLSNSGTPGIIIMDTDDGVLDVDASCSLSGLTIGGDVAIDLAPSTVLTASANVSDNTLTFTGSGTITRVDGTTGTILANGKVTITDLRVSFGSGGTFTYGGTGSSIVTSVANSTVGSGETFVKSGTGTLAITGGFGTLFDNAANVGLSIQEGVFINGSSTAPTDITLDDDGDEIFVASGATLTTYGGIEIRTAGTNVNVDAEEGSIVNLSGTADTPTLSAATDNDFQLLGTVNVNGVSGVYSLAGPYIFEFGDLNISGTAAFVNDVPSSQMHFVPDSEVDLIGSGDTGGRLEIDGQAASTRIVWTTTTGDGMFTVDRNSSDNLILDNVTISNSRYRSSDGGAGKDEITLSGAADAGNNVNWFSAEFVPNDDDVDEDEMEGDDDDDVVDEPDDDVDEVETTVGELVAVGSDGTARAAASSESSGASGAVTIDDATSGSVFVTVADGNLQSDFDGIPDETALPFTVRVTSSVTGEFAATVEMCYTDSLLRDSGLDESELVLYTYTEPDGPWALAGTEGRYRGDIAPTGIVGDYGIDTESMCLWVVRDGLSDFAAGAGPTDARGVSEDEIIDEDDSVGDEEPARPPLCGILGMFSMTLTMLGWAGLRFRRF